MTVYTEQLPVLPGLGRHVEHDSRSLDHPVTRRLAAKPIQPVEWPRHSSILDQKSTGACTGNAMAGWMACEPHCTSDTQGAWFTEEAALALYALATRLDSFPGSWPTTDSGSSGLAVAKGAQYLGMISAYSWATTTAQLLQALMYGPVIIGSVWTQDMFTPDSSGEIRPTGAQVGGHEWLCRGWDGKYLLPDNSWSTTWGPLGGRFKLSLPSWEILRNQRADVVMPHV